MRTARPTRPVMHTVDVPVAGWTLRIGMESGPDGTPRELHFAAGHGQGREWREIRGEGISAPASAAGAIADALRRLDAAGPYDPALPPGPAAATNCLHPARALTNPRLLDTTAGTWRVWGADCAECGDVAILGAPEYLGAAGAEPTMEG